MLVSFVCESVVLALQTVGPRRTHLRPAGGGQRLQPPVGGVLRRGDLYLAHLEHRLHSPAGTPGIGIVEQLIEPARNDLPGQPEAVLEPPARTRLAAVRRERVPQPIDLGPVVAADDERDRLVEREVRTTVEALEPLAGDGEVDRQHDARGPSRRLGR